MSIEIDKKIEVAGYQPTGEYRAPLFNEHYWGPLGERVVRCSGVDHKTRQIIVEPIPAITFKRGDVIEVKRNDDTLYEKYLLVQNSGRTLGVVSLGNHTMFSYDKHLPKEPTENRMRDYFKVRQHDIITVRLVDRNEFS